MTMIRKQIYIEPHQEAILKRMAELRGTSEAEIVRQAINRQAGTEAPHTLPLDPQAWEEARRFMLELRAKGPSTERSHIGNREDLYNDRMRRYARDVD